MPACVHGWSPLGACSICTPPTTSAPRASAMDRMTVGDAPALQIFDGERWVTAGDLLAGIDAQEAATGLVPEMDRVRDFLRRMAGVNP